MVWQPYFLFCYLEYFSSSNLQGFFSCGLGLPCSESPRAWRWPTGRRPSSSWPWKHKSDTQPEVRHSAPRLVIASVLNHSNQYSNTLQRFATKSFSSPALHTNVLLLSQTGQTWFKKLDKCEQLLRVFHTDLQLAVILLYVPDWRMFGKTSRLTCSSCAGGLWPSLSRFANHERWRGLKIRLPNSSA